MRRESLSGRGLLRQSQISQGLWKVPLRVFGICVLVAALVPFVKVVEVEVEAQTQIKEVNCNTGIGHAVRFKLPPNSCFGCVYQLSNGIRLGVVGTPTCIRWMIVEKPAVSVPLIPDIPNGVLLTKPLK